MVRPVLPDTFAGAPSSWAPLSPDGAREGGPQAGQLPLFDPPEAPSAARAPACPPVSATWGPARLRGHLQALLARSAVVAGAAPSRPRPAWPDSFFDIDGQP